MLSTKPVPGLFGQRADTPCTWSMARKELPLTPKNRGSCGNLVSGALEVPQTRIGLRFVYACPSLSVGPETQSGHWLRLDDVSPVVCYVYAGLWVSADGREA